MAGKLSISRAWDETRTILAKDGKLFATVAAALIVLPGVVRDMVTPAAEQGQLPSMGPWLLVWVAAFLIAIVGQLAITRLALADRTSVGEAIGHSARRMPIYVLAQILWALPFVLIFAALVHPVQNKSGPAALAFLVALVLFLFVSIRMILTPPIASQEAVGPVAIITRSWHQTAGNWWRLFGFFILFLIGASILILAGLAIMGLLVKTLFGTPEPLSVGGLLISLVSQILIAGVYVVLMSMVARLYAQAVGREASVPSSGI